MAGLKAKAAAAAVLVIMIAALFPQAAFAETSVKAFHDHEGYVFVKTYSTEKQEAGQVYELYISKKVNGKWSKYIYLRDITMPPANERIDGKKYKYRSADIEEVEWLKKRTIYRLFPKEQDSEDHASVPFWRNPLN